MADTDQLSRLQRNVKEWNTWRLDNPEVNPDLVEANLPGKDLSGADLSKADLRRALLYGADLTGANLCDAVLNGAELATASLTCSSLRGALLVRTDLNQTDLTAADLSDSHLDGALLIAAKLYQANLTQADLRGAHLQNAILGNANFEAATVGWTTFGNNDLSTVQGLETVVHDAPSYIGIDTVYRSKGCIPAGFLRGAGVPENFISYMRSLSGDALRFYSCFISHSSRDRHFCERLYSDLKRHQVRTWYFPEDARWGNTVWGEIDRGIRMYDKLIVVCSKHSLKSGPVLREIERALNREDRERRDILFPIRIDDYVFEKWEHERRDDVLNKVVGDFHNWKLQPESYVSAFTRLLSSLQSGEG